MATRRSTVVLLALALFAAACGARVDPQLRRQAANAQLGLGAGGSAAVAGQGSGEGSALGSQVGGVAAGPSGAAASGTASGLASGTAASATGTAAGGAAATTGAATGPAALNAPAPAEGNGGATDVGVTADSITVGNVADLTGPVPGLFQGAVTGTLAYFNYVNSQGGIYGRTLKLAPADSATQCAQTQDAYNTLIPKVLSFVGAFSLYDNCGAEALKAHADVATVSYVLSHEATSLPNDFSIDPIPTGGYPTGFFLYWKAKYGDAVQHVGTIYPDIPAAADSVHGIDNAAISVGWKFTYERAVAATETNFTTDVVRMKNSGVKIVYIAGENAANAATLVQEAAQQSWKPIFIIPISYAQNFVQLVGDPKLAEGIVGAQLFAMFFNADDGHNIPEVGRYQEWMAKTNPNQPEDNISSFSWDEAAMFVQALEAAGPKVTRASLLAALRNIHKFDNNGMIPAADPADKKPTTCYVLFEIHNGAFQRVDTPTVGYRCDGSFHYAGT